jgi:MATE family multidrug resistance protein
MTFKQFLEGLGNTFYSMLITIGCNILNVFLNFGFIYGYMGFPEMGVTGAGVATLISRIMMPVAFLVIVLVKKEYRHYFSYFSRAASSIKKQWELVKVGFPIAMQLTLELFSLTFMTIMMGWLGEKTLAANQITQTMMGFSFMIANGVAAASTILVSHDVGHKNVTAIKNHTYSGLHLGIAIMVFFALVYAFGGEYLARIFSADEEVIAITAKLFVVVALFEVIDGTQVTMLGALRGLTDVKFPMYCAVVCYLLVEIPVGYLLGFKLGLGAEGIVGGFMAGISLAAILFITRFRRIVRN